MADEQHVVRTISWTEIFSFPNVFKSFKMAIHPSKLLLALVAIALTAVLGCWVMDNLWAAASDTNRVRPQEPWQYWTAVNRSDFLDKKEKWVEKKEGRLEEMIRPIRPDDKELMKARDEALSAASKDFGDAMKETRKLLPKVYEAELEAADERWDKREKAFKEESDKEKAAEDKKTARTTLVNDRREALKAYVGSKKALARVRGGKIFASFLDWELHCMTNAFSAVRRGNFSTGLGDLYAARGKMTPPVYQPDREDQPLNITAGTRDDEALGLLSWLVLMAWGLWWMVTTFKWYSLIYVVVSLAIWAVLGGAICRIAALHAAREEKISLVSALKFGVSKFMSFFAAPLLPLVIIVIIGGVVAAGGALGAVPYAGEWFVGIFFLLALIAGAVMAFLTVGLVGGAPLMWPTIAVEGSDSFDAISRSFSYVFNRPFRYVLYWLAAAIHGTICYLFVRLFAFLTLRGTHTWAGWGMRLSARPEYADGAGKLHVMWAPPTFDTFHGPMQTEAMSASESAAAYVLALWVYLVIGLVLAFVVCYFFSAATNIYMLLRRKVDATDLDDVYVEELEEQGEPEAVAPAEEEQDKGDEEEK